MKDLFQRFNDLTVLIIGDVMVDSYLWGKVDRISPEAPVPVVHIYKRENRLGGAANVALNIQALGATPVICAAIGEDKDGEDFLEVMVNQQLSTDGIIRFPNRPTTVKTRVIGHNQQIVRIDSETDVNLDEPSTSQLVKKIAGLISSQKIDAIIFEDYDKGVISPSLINQVVELAEQKEIITVVDPKKRNFLDYHKVTLFKPNLKELREGLKVEVDPHKKEELDATVALLQSKLGCSKVMVTLSELGVYMNTGNDHRVIPAHIRNIADVSGAGDTVIATATLCLAAGLDDFTTAAVANLAGGLVCEHIGVVPINKEKLLQEAEKL
ncbi:D-glycero-beta-D-manno-heptose-7-phosphate kinase [Pedobacter sp. HMF7647]|uniref:D-glycero-beta-D-manno-heptose-7-phosphate kinase n=1 Tax=Hufsiella arboris TaxID=2695275 RepID=A0A7K1YDU9_9SPHI|nr:bifunctional ADP-heptose synthase [Hufsiella arboris]MXV52208.1 D-glycero-beta-D-manno-heptose-7-phosphate kinase [Hufsiella arboris]